MLRRFGISACQLWHQQYFDDQDLPFVMEKTACSWEEILTKAGLDVTSKQ